MIIVRRGKYLVWAVCGLTLIFLWIQIQQLSIIHQELTNTKPSATPRIRVVIETDLPGFQNGNLNNLKNIFDPKTKIEIPGETIFHDRPPTFTTNLPEDDLQSSWNDEEPEQIFEESPELPGARIFHGIIPMGKLNGPLACPVSQIDYESMFNFPVSGLVSHHGPKDILSSFFSADLILEPTRLDLIERLLIILQGERVSVLDIGAFVGLFSVVFASHYEVEKVYAFEPFSINIQRACETVELNHLTEKVNLYKVALGESYAREKWCLPYDNLGYAITEGCPLSGDQFFDYYNHESVQVVETEAWLMTSLSTVFAKPRGEHVIIIKLSVANGYEERILSAKALFGHSNVRHVFITGYWGEWQKYDPEKWVKDMKKMGWYFFTETCDPLDQLPVGELLQANPKLFITKDPKKVCANQNTTLLRPV